MTLADFKTTSEKIPDGPGVYFFLGPHKEILYIGKATSLRSRVRSYFSPDLVHTRGAFILDMIGRATSLDWREVDSVLEALIVEASLIRTNQPPYNTELKDDKSFNYVVITKEEFPRVLLMRGRELGNDKLKDETPKLKAIYGPFPHGLQLKEAMKIIRKIFPFRDKCEPGQRRPCFNRQLGLCPGVCSGEISKEEYARTVRHLMFFFQGKKKALLKELEREMKTAAKAEEFELAAEKRRQIFALQHIQDVSLIKDEYRKPYEPAKPNPNGYRIEAYDVAHMGGKATVGVMTVVEDGVVQKEQYRTFRIRQATGGDDPGALREILSRRLNHQEWLYPRLIVVDGSTAQMNAAQRVLDEVGIRIPIVGVVKNEKHQPRGISGDKDIIHEREQDILLANAEAHRFAIGYHRRRRTKDLFKR